VVWVQIRQCSVEGRGSILSQPADRCVWAFRVTVQDNYGLRIVVGRTACGCVASVPPETCIVAAFAAHQWTNAVLDGRCI